MMNEESYGRWFRARQASQGIQPAPRGVGAPSPTELGQVSGTAEALERARALGAGPGVSEAAARGTDWMTGREGGDITLRGAPAGQRQRPLDIPPVGAEVAVYPPRSPYPFDFERGRFLGPGPEPGQFRIEVGGAEQAVPGNRASFRGRFLSETRPLDVPPAGGAAMPEAATTRPAAPGHARLEPGAEIRFHPGLYDPAAPGQYVRADPSRPGFHIVRGADGRELSVPASRIEGAP